MCGGWVGKNVFEPIGLGEGLSNVPGFSEIGDVLASPFVQQVLPTVAGYVVGGPIGGALIGAATGAMLNYKDRGKGALFGALGGAGGGAFSAGGGFSGLLGGGEAAAGAGAGAGVEAGLESGVSSGLATGGEGLATGGAMGLEGSAPILAEQAAAPVLTSAENAALMGTQAAAPVAEAGAMNYAAYPGALETTVGAGGGIPVGPTGIGDTLMQAQAAGVPGIYGGAPATTGDTGMWQSLLSAFGGGGAPAAAGAGGGSNFLGNAMALSSLANAGIGAYQSNQLMQASQAADPWARYRAQYGDQLNQLMQNPSQIQNIPGYEAGMQAIQRSLAAQGYQGSGNMMNAMAQYGGNFYQQQLQNLSSLAGVGNTQLGLQGQFNASNMLGQSLQGIPNALLYANLLGRRGY